MTTAVVIRCGGKGGRCGHELARVVAEDGGLVLRLSDPRMPARLRETEVRDDFSGWAYVGKCPRHYRALANDGTRVNGGEMFRLARLRAKVDAWRASGNTQTVTYTPWPDDGSTVPT